MPKNQTGLSHASLYLREAGDANGAFQIAQLANQESKSALSLYALGAAAIDCNIAEVFSKAIEELDRGIDTSSPYYEFAQWAKNGPLKLECAIRKAHEPSARRIDSTPNRLLYALHQSLPHKSDGYANRSHHLANAISAQGIETVCVTRPGCLRDLGHLPIETTKVGGIHYEHLCHPALSDFPRQPRDGMPHASVGYLLEAARSWQRKINETCPEWVMAASNHVTALPAGIAAKSLGIPFIYEVRGFWEITHASRNPSYLKTVTGQREIYLETQTALLADGVITLNEEMKQELVLRGVRHEKIKIAANGCDIDEFTQEQKSQRLLAKYNISEDTVVIGYIGTFSRYEGLEFLVEACGILKQKGVEFRLLLVGDDNTGKDGDRGVAEDIQKIAQKYGFSDWLIMPGRVPHDQVQSYYSLVDIAPFPRSSTPVTELVSPLKPLEAMALGKAVIASSVRPLLDLVKDDVTGKVMYEGTINELVDTLHYLACETDQRAFLGKNARNHVANELTWQKAAEQAINLFHYISRPSEHSLNV